ncbi:hypothetical protein ACFX13_021477 [Malus domestica]|uniref:uncharacterized protein n=1 Tax=Malus domestica TaxID=3750 RepID=UPI000498B133|nr:uncharacterized protein LOC103402980 [Malus domestica]XP_050129566.1 uncharacterized protein LOC126606250 [Malus sylvestris]
MGNCQAIDAAALVIQHPSGKIERMYWPISASEVMRLNPGHYVSLIIPLPVSEQNHKQVAENHEEEHGKAVRFTRIKLLRPNETLALGHAYRLVTTQEVMKVLKAKKYAKTKKQQLEVLEKLQTEQGKENSGCSGCKEEAAKSDEKENINHASKRERHRPGTSSANAAAAAAAALRSKSWRPSLQSICEGATDQRFPNIESEHNESRQ